MDKYVIDLDKVLDELELNDEQDVEESVAKKPATPSEHQYGEYNFSNIDKINVEDADFSIHIKPLKLMTNTDNVANVSCTMLEPNNNSIIDKTDTNVGESSKKVDTTKFELLNDLEQIPDLIVPETGTSNLLEPVLSDLKIGSESVTECSDPEKAETKIEVKVEDFAPIGVSPENSDSETIKGENDDDNDEPSCCDNNSDVQNEKHFATIGTNQTESDQNWENRTDEKSMADLPEPHETPSCVSEPLIGNLEPAKTELPEQNDCSESTILDGSAIETMPESELDKYLSDLIYNDDVEAGEIENDDEARENREIEAIVHDRPLPPEKESNTIKIVEKNSSESQDAQVGSGAGSSHVDPEQATHLQELEELLAASGANSNQNPVTDSPASPPQPNLETRGGLVQNINYFERQEMPNGLTEEEHLLGKVKPFWIPDEDAQNCLHCDVKFTMIKRRHHCRSCGKVLCAQCCNFKAKLPYLEFKEARVCQLCYAILMRIEEIERINGHQLDTSSAMSNSHAMNAHNVPDPNNPAEYCSTIPPLEQVSETVQLPPPTVMVPVGVLKRPGSSNLRRSNNSPESSTGEREQVKQVMFSDGVRPGGDLVESPSSSRLPVEPEKPVTRTQLQPKSQLAEKILVPFENLSKRIKMSRVVVIDPPGVNLPPIINYFELKTANPSLPSKPNYSQLIECLRDPKLPHITFGLTKNLHVNTKIVKKFCCNNKECWTFSSKGLASVGQDEVLFVLDCDSVVKSVATTAGAQNEKSQPENPADEPMKFPRDVFRLYTLLYDCASTANLYMDLSHIFFPDGLFGNKENSGFLFTRPTLQCFENISHLPPPPFLVALLIHKWEIPWAKVFPLRLALRLGFEYKMYPSPVISYANRKPVYFEVGHTIMNVLADFRNFHYTLSVVKDLFIIVEEKKRVNLLIPKLSYEKVCRVLSTSNEHVLAFGGNLSLKADSHFACVQNEDEYDIHSQYHTQIFSYPDSPQKKTGASFIVFSGALKSTTGLKAKMNIVEDGLLVQILPNVMEQFRSAIKDMKDFRIDCGKANETELSDEWVQLKWVNDELTTNLGVRSQIDGLNLEGVQSARIFSNPDYANERYLIRWIEVFLLKINENSRRSEMINANRLAESVAQAFCLALVEYLDQLYENGLTKISLRISLDVDKVGYETGSGGKPLPAPITQPLDCALIPVIMENISTTGIEDPLVIELLFFVLLK